MLDEFCCLEIDHWFNQLNLKQSFKKVTNSTCNSQHKSSGVITISNILLFNYVATHKFELLKFVAFQDLFKLNKKLKISTRKSCPVPNLTFCVCQQEKSNKEIKFQKCNLKTAHLEASFFIIIICGGFYNTTCTNSNRKCSQFWHLISASLRSVLCRVAEP